jgi:hypothetical protein
MKIGIQGTNSFEDYSVFLRAMGNALADMKTEDKEFLVFSAGPFRINEIAQEFINVSENNFKLRGIKTKLIKVPPSWIKNNISEISHFYFFSKPKESVSDLVDFADSKNIEVGVYRY